MSNQASDFKVVDIIDKIIETVRTTRNTTLDVKEHTVKMILYRDYNIDIALDAIKRRLKFKNVH